MPLLMLRELPPLKCLQEAAATVPGMDPAACELYFQLLHTGDIISRAEGDFLGRHDLNHARMVVLILLKEATEGGMRSSQLAEETNVSRATITGLLDTMARADLITRTQEADDRRASQVRITPKGLDLLEKACPEFLQWSSQKLTVLTKTERDQLSHLLGKIREVFTTQAPSSPSSL